MVIVPATASVATTLGLIITIFTAPFASTISDPIATNTTKEKVNSSSETQEQTKDEDVNETYIYRTGSGNFTNLTPRPNDITGLSFTTTRPYMGDYSITTMEAVNASGYLIAVQDGPHHVSVLPVDINKMQEWIDSRPTVLVKPHLITQILSEITRKVR